MQNLRKIRGSLKGNVGEAIFTSTFGYVHGTKFDTYHLLDNLPLIIPEKMKSFLKEHWASIDAFEFTDEENGFDIDSLILYEIKTMNYYTTKGVNFGKRPVLTENANKVYSLAKKLGFIVKSAWIILYNNWDYDIQVKPFRREDYRLWSGNPTNAKTI